MNNYVKIEKQELLTLLHNQRQKCVAALDVEWHERQGKTYIDADDYKLLLSYWQR